MQAGLADFETVLGIWIPTSKGGVEQPAAEGGDGQGEGKTRRRFVTGTVFDISRTDTDGGTAAAIDAGTTAAA